MKPSSSISLAVASLLCLVGSGFAATRPHYGGTLRIAFRETPQAFNPSSLANSPCRNLSPLVFETLVAFDARGRLKPQLAASWQPDAGNQRWRFFLRDGVSFHDGTSLDSAAVAASLRAQNPDWKVLATGDVVTIETQTPDPELPAELALERNAIFRGGREHATGTGPFSIGEWVVGQRLHLNANPQYWGGPPFLDAIEAQFGLADRDQMIALDLGRLDVAEVAAEAIRRARGENRFLLNSEPAELIALVFARNPQSAEETHTRNALALALNTQAMNEVLVQGEGDATSSLLPDWLSGYAFLFRSPFLTEHLNVVASDGKPAPSFTLSYDDSDPLARVIAERVLLNARDVGIRLDFMTARNSDLHLRRFSLACPQPQVALIELTRSLDLPRPQLGARSIADLYAAEKALLDSQRVIPLIHLRSAIAIRPNVRGVAMLADGSWQLSDAWLAPEKP